MKKKFRDIIVNEENYEWTFSGVVRIREKNNNSINLTIDIGWYDVWLYIYSLPPDDCELWEVTPSFVKEAILFALDKGWRKERKQLYLKYKNKNFKVVENHNKIPDLEAEIYYLKTEEGGRKTAISSGYRGQFYYNNRDWDAPQTFIDKEIVQPGETVKAYLTTLSPALHEGNFFVGKTFEIREGAKTVGKGKITKILNLDFNIPNFEKIIFSVIQNYTEEFIKPREFLQSIIKTKEYKPILRHFFGGEQDILYLFQELEKSNILERITDTKYKKLIV